MSIMATIKGVWVLNGQLSDFYNISQELNFTSNDVLYIGMAFSEYSSSGAFGLCYYTSNFGSHYNDNSNFSIASNNSGLMSDDYKIITINEEQTVSDDFYTWFIANATEQKSALKYIHLYRGDNLPYKIYQAETDADMDILKNDEEADGCVVEFIGTSASGAYEQGRFYICERDITLPTFIIYASDYYHDCEYEGKEYQYEEGMTWGEWLTSDYNVDGWEDDGQSCVTPHPGTYYVVRNTSSVWVTLSDVISDDQYWCYEQ